MNIVYVSFNSINEPLVQSQVLSYLRGLTIFGHKFYLPTFEPEEVSPERAQKINSLLKEHAIKWGHVGYPSSRSPLKFREALKNAESRIGKLLTSQNIDLIHARSFLPAIAARWVSRKHKVPFLLDACGFWAAEKAYKGRLPVRSIGCEYYT
jgi:hypothetical protein